MFPNWFVILLCFGSAIIAAFQAQRNPRYGTFVVLLGGMGLLVLGTNLWDYFNPPPPPSAPRDEYVTASVFVVDPVSGCQYIQSYSGTLTPRLDSLGKQMCGHSEAVIKAQTTPVVRKDSAKKATYENNLKYLLEGNASWSTTGAVSLPSKQLPRDTL